MYVYGILHITFLGGFLNKKTGVLMLTFSVSLFQFAVMASSFSFESAKANIRRIGAKFDTVSYITWYQYVIYLVLFHMLFCQGQIIIHLFRYGTSCNIYKD